MLRAICGNALSSAYGAAMPVPMVPNTVSTVARLPLAAAQPAAAPISGAVQGVLSTAVMMPITKLPPMVSWLASIECTHCGRFTLKKPAMPKAITAMNSPRPIVNSGYWNS